MPNRNRTAVVLLLLAALVLGACTPAIAPTTTGDSQPAAAPAEVEQVIRTLERGKKEVIYPGAEGGSGRLWVRVVWLSPFELQPDGTVANSLAIGYEMSEDGLVHTLQLDPDAVFSNGKPITAAAVKEAWEWGMKAENLPGWGGLSLVLGKVVGLSDITAGTSDDAAGLEAVDDYTLRITLSDRVIGFKDSLASYMLGVFDVSEDVDNPDYWRKPAVSGPYQIEWDLDSGDVNLTPNPNWWGTAPTLQRIEVKIVADPQTRLLAYENGEVDLLKDTGDLVEQAMATFPEQMVPIPSLGFFFLGFNNQLPPTDDVHVRRALLYSIDRRAVINTLFPGRTVVDTIMQPGMPCYDETFSIPYDPERAREELAKSAYGSAENMPPIRIQYWADINFWGRILTAYQQQWQENLGVTVEISGVDAYNQAEFNLHRLSGGPNVNDPSDILSVLGLPDGSYATYQMYMPPAELSDLVLEANALAESDVDARCALYRQIEETLITEDVALIPQIGVPYSWIVKPYIQNLETTLNQDINWDEIVIVK
jgi:oligopeptide transport system substrate-binding protein